MTDEQIELLFEVLLTILRNQKHGIELDSCTKTGEVYRKCEKMLKKLKKEENNGSIEK